MLSLKLADEVRFRRFPIIATGQVLVIFVTSFAFCSKVSDVAYEKDGLSLILFPGRAPLL